MDLKILKNLQTLGAGALNKSLSLDFGNRFVRSYKAAQNRLVSENIFRKSTQLVNDLLALRKLKTDNGTQALPQDPIPKAVQDIMDLREKLGVDNDQTPAERVLSEILQPKRGSLFDGKS
jgi:hypothetical protein